MSALSQVLRYALSIGLMVPMLSLALLVGVFHRRWGWRIGRAWNRCVLFLFGVTVSIEYEDAPQAYEGGGVMVGLCQQSLIDPTLGYAAMPRHWLSIWNLEYALIPFLGWLSWILGWVIVRQRPQQARRQLSKAALYAKQGGLVYLSAEGRRSVDGSLSPYKKGPAVLAIESGTRIFPMYIHGTRAIIPYGSWKIAPGPVRVCFLKPIPVAGLAYEDRDQLTAQLWQLGQREHAAA